MKTFVVSAAAAIAMGSLAAGGHPEIPNAWRPIPVCGKTFYNANLGPNKHMFALWDNYRGDPMFENMWLYVAGPFNQNDKSVYVAPGGKCYFGPLRTGRAISPASGDVPWTKSPARLDDVIASWKARGKWFDEFEKRSPGGPITIHFYGAGPAYALKEGPFDVDPSSLDEFKRRHPGFVAFMAYEEYDNCTQVFQSRHGSFTNEADRARIMRQYPRERMHEARRWGDVDYAKFKAFHFESSDLGGLWSIWPTYAFEIARHGVKCLWYEAEMGSTSSPWRWGGLYARGASRQFRTPLGWYTAQYTHNTCMRDGSRPKDLLIDGVSVTRWPWVGNRTQRKYLGTARSLMKRNEAYGYFIGCVAEMLEAGATFLTTFTEEEPDKVILSPYGEDFRQFFVWNKAHDRGVVYTPVALLVSLDEVFDRQSYKTAHNNDPVSQTAFMTTLCCPRIRDAARCTDERNGLQGCLFNSEFGEIADALCADSGQDSRDFLSVLSAYKCAFLVGWFNPRHFDRRAVVEYVRRGGVLYAERRHVDDGYIPESVPGAKGRIVVVDSFLSDYVRDPKVPYWDEKVQRLFSGEATNPVLRDLLLRAQEQYMPVRVDGDIQWGCNLTERGWLVWLLNNKGVKKFLTEPEELDLSKTATVRITDKATGRVYTSTVKPGDWAAVEIFRDGTAPSN